MGQSSKSGPSLSFIFSLCRAASLLPSFLPAAFSAAAFAVFHLDLRTLVSSTVEGEGDAMAESISVAEEVVNPGWFSGFSANAK